MFPVPGPISRTTSVGLIADLATMAVTTAGFLRKCWPKLVFGAIRLDEDEESLPLLPPFLLAIADIAEYGADAATSARLRFFLEDLGMLFVFVLPAAVLFFVAKFAI